jgi:hypothetical protein
VVGMFGEKQGAVISRIWTHFGIFASTYIYIKRYIYIIQMIYRTANHQLELLYTQEESKGITASTLPKP